MAFVRPNPNRPSEKKGPGAVDTILEAEKLFQIAVLLPSSTLAGWFFGGWLDGRLHQNWMALAGLFVGGILGMLYVVRLAWQSLNNTDKAGK